MKLYYMPGACSLSPHIIALETGEPLELEKVDGKTKKTASGKDFNAINPKGYVPALELEDGQILTEGPAIVQYLADRHPESGLIPKPGTLERYRVQEVLGYINSEIHKSYATIFNPAVTPEVRSERTENLKKRYAFLDKQLAGRDYLVGDGFGVGDAYLFTVTNWAPHLKVDLSEFRNIAAFQQRVSARPAVQAALKAEGLLK